MDFLLEVDLDWLCLGAEFAAGLLILTLAWRPGSKSAKASALQVASMVDWEPLQVTHSLAVTGHGRSLSLRENPTDQQRLRELLIGLPNPSRDRLTGTLNAIGMDRLIRDWSSESDMGSYPSCYAKLSLSNAQPLMEQYGATCIEHAVKKISELLTESLGGRASISRYQPHGFLLHCFGKTLTECQGSFTEICEQIALPEFFLFQEEAIGLACEMNYWSCNRGVEPDELLQLLSEFGEESSSEREEVVPEAAASEPEVVPEPEKPFSIDALAQFPCPWDDPPEEPEAPLATTTLAAETNEIQEDQSSVQVPAEAVSSETLEGFASTEQIDELLSQLNSDAIPEPVLEESYAEDPIPPMQSEVDESTSIFGPEDEDSEDSRMHANNTNPEESTSEKQPPVRTVEMLEPVMEMPTARSIYTDDIEESILKDDLASLFAAVRSSAMGDFGYEDTQSSKSGPDKPSLPQ